MKYYEVSCMCGHVGRNKYIQMNFYEKATNKKEASDKVRKKPRVKRHQKNTVLSISEINKDQYLAGLERNRQNPYFSATNIQEQRMYCDILSMDIQELPTRKYEKETISMRNIYFGKTRIHKPKVFLRCNVEF